MRTRGRRGACSAPSHCQTTVWLTETALAEFTHGQPGGLPRLLKRLGELLKLSLARHLVSSPVTTSRAACLTSAPSVEGTQPVGKAHASGGGTSLDAWQVIMLTVMHRVVVPGTSRKERVMA